MIGWGVRELGTRSVKCVTCPASVAVQLIKFVVQVRLYYFFYLDNGILVKNTIIYKRYSLLVWL